MRQESLQETAALASDTGLRMEHAIAFTWAEKLLLELGEKRRVKRILDFM